MAARASPRTQRAFLNPFDYPRSLAQQPEANRHPGGGAELQRIRIDSPFRGDKEFDGSAGAVEAGTALSAKAVLVTSVGAAVHAHMPEEPSRDQTHPRPQQVISLARQFGFEIYRVEDAEARLTSVRSGDSLKIVQSKGEQIPIRWVDGVLRADRPAEHNVRFYAGQLDPNDPSHFTIDYELNGVRNVIDGWLTDDDFLRIRPRGGKVAGGDWRIAEKP